MEDDTDVPQERETKDFQFRQLKKVRLFNSPPDLPKERSSLLAISNKYGLLFSASPAGFKVYHTKDVLIPNKAGENPNNSVAGPPGIDVRTKYPVHHIALSSDNLTLSVCMSSREHGSFVSFYDVRALMNEARQPKEAFASERLLREADSLVTDLKWNPAVASMLAVCMSDGSISILQVTDSVTLYANLPTSLGVTSMCWSPKGKQLAIGKQNGTIVQYLPNLQEKKVIPCPSFYDSDNPVKVLDVLWVSTYVFAVVYAAADGSLETSPQLVMVLLPKKEDKRGERFLNFMETCYSSCSERQHHFFMNYIEDWNVLLGASAASVEVSVIAKPPDQNIWEQWLLEDSSRAELPVTASNDDTLPMGVVVDYSNQLDIFVSEEKILPPTPVLLMLSTDGVLNSFHVINLNPGVKSLTCPPEQLHVGGERLAKPTASSVVTPPSGPVPGAPVFSAPGSSLGGNAQAFSMPASSLPGKMVTPPSGPLTPVSTLSANSQTPPPAFSISASSLTSKTASPAFSLPTTSLAAKQQTGPPAFSFTSSTLASKPDSTSTAFAAPTTSFPSQTPAIATGFGVSSTSNTNQAAVTAPGFGISTTSLSVKASASQPSFSVISSASVSSTSSSLFGTSAKQPTSQPFSFSMQTPVVFGTSTPKPEISTTSTQAADSSSAAPSSVKVNLKDKFSAVDTHQAGATFVSSAQNFSFTPQAKPTSAAGPNSHVTLSSQTAATPSRPFAEAAPNAPTARPSQPVVKQAPAQPLANVSFDNRVKAVKDNDPILTGIKDEIAHFQKEMDDLKARTAKACFTVGSEEQMRQLRTESDDLHSFLMEIKETTESLHGDTGCLKTTLLEGFASVEDAKEQNERKKDPLYRQLLYKKPLDPKSEAQMKEIRRLHQYVKFAVQDVNDVLDLEWDRHVQNRRKQKGIAIPERETLFNTLANNQEIINQQRQRLNQLVESLQQLRLYNQISKWNMPKDKEINNHSLEAELESLRNALPKMTLDKEPKPIVKPSPKLSPVKQGQLRNFLTKRKTPPIRTLAPASLQRSSFLAPSYYEDLDDVSSSSSISEAPDNEERRPVAQRESARQETPPPEPAPVQTARHAPITRTASVQPGFATPSLPFGKAQSIMGPITSTPAVSAQPVRVIPQGADSTMLATKTVKHGAPPAVTPQAAAAAAALRRQMTSQVPASLTESTLQTVPQVVNVKELKGNGPTLNFPTVIGPSVPHSAAQVIHQVLATVGSAPAKQIPPAGGIKMPSAPASHSSVTAQPAAVFAPNKTTGLANMKSQTPIVSSSGSGAPGTQGFSFAARSVAFSMGQATPSSSTLGNTDSAKETNQPAVFTTGTGNKHPFGPGSELPLSFTSLKPPSTSAAPADSAVSKSTPAQAAPTPSMTSAATKTGDTSTQGFSGGETLGSFSGLRVGQIEDAPKTDFTKVPPQTQPVKMASVGPLSGFAGGFQPSKPAEPPSTTSGSSAMLFGNMQLPSTGSLGGLFNSGAIKPSISFTAPTSAASASDPSSGAPASVAPVFGGFMSPVSPAQSSVGLIAGISSTADSSSHGSDVKQSAAPAKSIPEPAAPSQLQALLGVTSEGTREPPPYQTTSTTSSADTTTQPAAPAIGASQPPSETKQAVAPVSAFPAALSLGQTAPTTSTPAVVSPPPPPTSTSSVGLSSQTPVLVTATTTPATASAPDTSTTAPTFSQPPVTSSSAAPAVLVFGQTPATSSGPSLFGQQSNNTTSTSGSAPTAFGSFGASDGSGGFGLPVFGQVASFWKAPAGSASNFSFAQPGFGSQSVFGQTPASTAAASSSSGLFGSASANTSIAASSFSFTIPSTSNASTAGGGLFGQSSAPVFGQSSSFGQSASVFGGATSSTTTTSSSGFAFGQSTGFGSSSSSSVFGQPQNTGTSVFGQSAPSSSSGGLFGASSSNTSGGGFFSGLGGKPSQENANKNPFGSSAFGASSSANTTSLFGNSGAKSFGFGSSSFGDQKSSGTFSAAGGSVSTQGFGFTSPNKTGGFGAAPVFGSPPTFGGSPGFGGVPAFGSAPSFASPLGSTEGKVFGEGTAAANTGVFGFGSNSASTTFGNLANQSAPSFGGISQQAVGFGGQSSGFSGFGSGNSGATPGNSGGFSFGVSNQSMSGFGGGWRG